MEFLTIYGFAFLALIVLLSSLFYLGIFDLKSLQGESRRGFVNVVPIDWVLSSNGTLFLQLKNNAGTSIVVNNITGAIDQQQGFSVMSLPISLGGIALLQTSGMPSYNYNDFYELKLVIHYTDSETSYSYVESGFLTGRISNNAGLLNTTPTPTATPTATPTPVPTATPTATPVPDTTPPVITIQSPVDSFVYNNRTLWFNATVNEVAANCSVSIDSSVNQSLSNTSGNWNAFLLNSPGSHSVRFYCADLAGNTGSTLAAYSIRPKLDERTLFSGVDTSDSVLVLLSVQSFNTARDIYYAQRNSGTYNESRYQQYDFNYSISPSATIVNTSVLFVYQIGHNQITQSKLEAFRNTNSSWMNYVLTKPGSINTDLNTTTNLTVNINTPLQINALSLRFLSRVSVNQNRTTSTNYVKTIVWYFEP